MLAGVGICSLAGAGVSGEACGETAQGKARDGAGPDFGRTGIRHLRARADAERYSWIGVPVMALWGIATPSLQALMTRLVDATEQGRLQGSLASLQGLASLIGPTMFTQIFAAFISTRAAFKVPGAPFLLAALLLITAMLLAWRTTRPSPIVAATEAA